MSDLSREFPVFQSPELKAGLRLAWADATAAWPQLHVAPGTYYRLLGKCLTGSADPAAALKTLHVSDLYLVAGCLAGQGKALASFEKLLLLEVSVALRTFSGDSELSDEVRQHLRQQFFLPSKGESKLATYSGKGPLTKWLRTVAVRTALNSRRADHRRVEREQDLLDAPAFARDPELSFIRKRYRVEVKAAFQEVWTLLGARERTLLRLHFLEGVPVESLGKMYQAHRATVHRWLASARESLLRDMRAGLAKRLKIDSPEVDEIINLMGSQLELSVRSLLRTKP